MIVIVNVVVVSIIVFNKPYHIHGMIEQILHRGSVGFFKKPFHIQILAKNAPFVCIQNLVDNFQSIRQFMVDVMISKFFAPLTKYIRWSYVWIHNQCTPQRLQKASNVIVHTWRIVSYSAKFFNHFFNIIITKGQITINISWHIAIWRNEKYVYYYIGIETNLQFIHLTKRRIPYKIFV